MAKLEKKFRPALESVVSRSDRITEARVYVGKARRQAWVGTREHGLMGNTVNALAERGLVEVKIATKPYRRLVCRPTAAGRAALEEV